MTSNTATLKVSVACLSPQITEEKLKQYEELAKTAEPDVQDGFMTCLKVVKAWWDLPESTTDKIPHPSRKAVVQALDDTTKVALWDLIPWGDELDMIQLRFDKIDQEVVKQNGQRVEAWQNLVTNTIIKQYFPDPEVMVALRVIAPQLEALKKILNEAEWQKLAGQLETATKCSQELLQALQTKQYPKVPYPALTPTPLRDAAFHLLWYVRELNLDREPLHIQ